MNAPPPLGEPRATQLIEAVASYLETVALPKLEGHAAFHGRVAVNVLNIVKRELEMGTAAAQAERGRLAALLGKDGDLDALRRQLCAQLRAGAMSMETPKLAEHLLATAAERVRIEQPQYATLKRV